MPDLANIGVSGLLAAQQGLTTTGQNISNLNTPGYSRQRIEQTARPAEFAGNGAFGTGVQVTGTRRSYDALLTQQLQQAEAGASASRTYAELAAQVDNVLAGTSGNLGEGFARFADAANALAADPADPATRQVLLAETANLAAQFNDSAAQLERIETMVNNTIGNSVAEINRLGQQIAVLNGQIMDTGSAAGTMPLNLLDQRDAAIQELAKYVDVTTASEPGGALNVYVGSGQSLVVGRNSQALAVTADPFDPTRPQVAFASGGSIDSQLTGGELGGTLAFRRELFEPAQRELDTLALGVAGAANIAQAGGVDRNGQPGLPLYNVPAPQVQVPRGQATTSLPQVQVTDLMAVQPQAYRLGYDGAQWHLTDDAGAVLAAGSGSFLVDGLEITPPTGASAGDRYRLLPAGGAAAGLAAAPRTGAELAAAAPILGQADAGNLGEAQISPGVVLDAANPALRDTVALTFIDAATYQIDGGPPQSYVPGEAIAYNGWQVEIQGTPAAGDRFSVSANGNPGDGRNAAALAQSLDQGLFEGGTVSPGERFAGMLASVGAATRAAEGRAEARDTILGEAQVARDAVAGVNLDEEAANLLRYEQAYQAAARIIAVADEVFRTLLNAVGR